MSSALSYIAEIRAELKTEFFSVGPITNTIAKTGFVI